MYGGVAFERGDPGHRIGMQLGGVLDVSLSSRLMMRFDVSYLGFGKSPDVTYVTPCLAPSSGAPPCGPVRLAGSRLMFWNSTIDLGLREQRDRYALYWIAGAGVYHVSNDRTRLGWNVGGGVRLSRSLFVDLRYHQLVASRGTQSLVPLSVFLRF
jgi:hypothetical protein